MNLHHITSPFQISVMMLIIPPHYKDWVVILNSLIFTRHFGILSRTVLKKSKVLVLLQ